MPPAPVEIRPERIAKSFGERVVLTDISFEVGAGELVAIVGGSGSGKTVLLHTIVGLLPPDSGRVMVADHGLAGAPLQNLYELDEDGLDRVRLHWALVFQHNALFSGSVYGNVSLWLREHTNMDERAIERRVRQSLGAVALDVEDVITKKRDELSGGMAKRVAIARAIAVDPAVMFYDEPTTGLDPDSAARIHELVWETHLRPRADGTRRTSIIVTHDLELLRRLKPRIIMLHQAAVCYDGSYDLFGVDDRCPPARAYRLTMPVLHARPGT